MGELRVMLSLAAACRNLGNHSPALASLRTPRRAEAQAAGSRGEYAIKSEAPRCALCGSPIFIEFYRVNSKLACASAVCGAQRACAGQSGFIMHGLTYGVFAAGVAMAVYALFTIFTHLYLGYVR